MSKNNIYPLVGPAYPLFRPVHLSKSKPKWLPWGRTPAPILPLGGGVSESYFRHRSAPMPVTDDQSESYPRVINEFTKENI
jgi:hypothetical protein